MTMANRAPRPERQGAAEVLYRSQYKAAAAQES
jgi:hypothetical protein